MSHMSDKYASSSLPPQSSEIMDETPLTQLLSVATTVLHQALDLVENVLTSDDQLTVHSKHLPGSTIGESPS